uniref:PH domain-containing protein n=1 Tax=Parascaris univalens TaxID=6257 RepID=A0A915A802_PARUN
MSTGGEVNSIFRRIYNRWWKRTNSEPDNGDSESSFGEIVRTIASSGNILKSGYLSKKRWKIGSFSKYFVLRDDAKFYYYKSRTDSNIPQNYSGVVQLKDVYIMPHGSRVFSIHSNNGVWRLKAKNSEERDGWVKKLRFARACIQAKEENELVQFTSGCCEQRKQEFDVNALPDLDRLVKELIKCAATLTAHSSELHPSGGHHSARKSNRSKEYFDDRSVTMSIRFKNFKVAAKRYLQQSAAIQDYIRRINEELRYVSEQRTNLIRQLETQAKQLKMISKSARITESGAIIEAKVDTELAKLEDSAIIERNVNDMDSNELSDFDTSDIEADDISVTGSDVSEEQKWKSEEVADESGKAHQQKKGDEKSSVPGRSSSTKEERGKEIIKQTGGSTTQVNDENELSTARDKLISEKRVDDKEVQSSKLHAVRKARDVAEKVNQEPRGPAKHGDPMLLSRSIEMNRIRRTRIPDRKAAGFALWSILKNALGKELSRIPLPVDFNEPLSFIQRMSEVLEYSSLLDSAATIQSSSLQMVYVTAFVISCWSNTPFRTCKPFNPLWSETFEFDRTADLGWKSVAEQVSHHPPIGMLHADGRGWTYDEEMCVISQFQATAMRLYPEGCSMLSFPNTTNGERCRIELSPHSFFPSSSSRSFVAKVFSRAGNLLYALEGDWSKYCNLVTGKRLESRQTIWSRRTPPECSHKMYNFSTFAIELNEFEEGVAPTDSRRRPDMRLMENGDWAAANEEKSRLEQKQRAATRRYQEMMESRKPVIERPVWFKKITDTRCEGFRYKYGGNYWKCKKAQDWTRCPDIFGRP